MGYYNKGDKKILWMEAFLLISFILFSVFVAKYTYDPEQFSPNENPDAELHLNAGDYVFVYGDMDEVSELVSELFLKKSPFSVYLFSVFIPYPLCLHESSTFEHFWAKLKLQGKSKAF